MNEFDVISFDDLENSFNYSNSRDNYLYFDNDFTDYPELEEQEEQSEVADEDEQSEIIDYSSILNDIYDELSDIHADIIVLNDNICGVSQCISDFANVFVELFVIAVFLFMCKTAFDSLLHFFK